LAQALLDCVKGIMRIILIIFTDLFSEVHQNMFQQFDVFHCDIHIGNLYIKTDDLDGTLGWEIGSMLRDWGFVNCKETQKVLECLE
jgi:predicted unusual protein kinase regulating ubiquinone biosynthesis (AarF/ABC1/UbiB family)